MPLPLPKGSCRLLTTSIRRWWRALHSDGDLRKGRRYFGSLGIHHVRTLVDVGANEGQFLFPALKYLTPQRAIAVEMLPDCARRIAERAPGHVRVFSCAVGAQRGQEPCLRSNYSPASSLLEILPEASALYEKNLSQTCAGAVEIRALDELCLDAGIDSVDLLKIDVQGYELHVLRGAEQVLSRTRQVIVEVEFVPIYQGGPLFPAVWEKLGSCGFVLSQIFAQRRSRNGILLHADALFSARRALEEG